MRKENEIATKKMQDFLNTQTDKYLTYDEAVKSRLELYSVRIII